MNNVTLNPLDALRIWRELNSQRGNLITQARQQGRTWGEIQDATGLSRATCHNLQRNFREQQSPDLHKQ